MVLIMTRPHSQVIIVSVVLYFCHSDIATNPELSTFHWRDLVWRLMTICPCSPQRYFSVKQHATTAHKARTKILSQPHNYTERVPHMNLKKSRFFIDSIDYLSHVIWPKHLELSSCRTTTIRRLQTSKNPCKTLLFASFMHHLSTVCPNLCVARRSAKSALQS